MARNIVKIVCRMMDVYVRRDKIFTNGLVVMKKAYSLNCSCAAEPESMINWRFPTKCPIKNKVRNNPDRAARVFLKSVDVK
jgi:hypothetical protein